MKLLLIALLLPFSLTAMCKDCSFYTHIYLGQYRNHYENAALHYSPRIVDIEDLKDAREKAIFYSGGAFAIDQLIRQEEQY